MIFSSSARKVFSDRDRVRRILRSKHYMMILVFLQFILYVKGSGTCPHVYCTDLISIPSILINTKSKLFDTMTRDYFNVVIPGHRVNCQNDHTIKGRTAGHSLNYLVGAHLGHTQTSLYNTFRNQGLSFGNPLLIQRSNFYKLTTPRAKA